ncbi:MAG: hypothetical protein CL868_19740 [Cytophagaceae bacterium]|nr:hypothetical protein [Cytophagaceae bacterium]|tara:strand:+ start:5957 stop:6151 length:195 start_codon:yes stop_codon:yes gene_type:complete
MKLSRLCIYPKDIQRITGRSERYGRQLLMDIKLYLGKEKHQFVTIYEFAMYCGLEVEEVAAFIV